MDMLPCPFCGRLYLPTLEDAAYLQQHVEEEHIHDSPFRVQPSEGSRATSPPPYEASGHDDQDDFACCPVAECGEYVHLAEYSDHLDLHEAEGLNIDQAISSTSHSKHHDMHPNPSLLGRTNSMTTPEHKRHRKSKRRSSSGAKSILTRSIFTLSSSSPSSSSSSSRPRRKSGKSRTLRLGRKELGPYAWEDRMPKWLEKMISDGPKVSVINKIGGDGRLIKQEVVENETPGILQVLVQLSQTDRAVREAYYCHPSTVHICHTQKEGGFCGYRNLQMLISYIQGARAQGHPEFTGRTPNILVLQDIIEAAWDKGINEFGRAETGGIRRTRKWIGTPEAQAVFLNLQIDSAVQMFTDNSSASALEQLLSFVENYFRQFTKDPDQKVHRTLAPPIYLQHPGHSLTIVGFERRKDGPANLIVFDPMFRTSPAMHRLLGRQNISTPRPEVMDAYRRDGKKLRRHRDFEILLLTSPPPAFPAWAV